MALVEKLGLDNSSFNSSLDDSKKKVEEFQDKTEDASKSLDDMSKHGGKSAKELLKQMSELDKSNRSVSNYRKQLGQLTRDIQDLTVQYRQMSDEMKNSDIGREALLKIQELTKEAANYKDALLDSQNAIKNLASDTAGWDAAKQGIQAVSGALQGIAAAGVLGADNTEKLVKVIARLKAIESAVNGVIAIGNALQKDSALMQGIAAIQAKALGKAKLEEAAATEVASTAQAKFNLIASANPYVLLATAAIAAIAGIVAFSKAMDDNAKKAEDAKKASEEYAKSIEGIATSIADSAFQYDELKEAYSNIRTEGEKQEFMDKYKSKMHDIGIEISDVNQLEDVFGASSEEFRDACLKRAEAMAYTQEIMEQYRVAIKAVMEAENILSNIKPGQRINEGDPAYELLKQYGAYTDDVKRLGKDYVNVSDDFYDTVINGIKAKSDQAIQTMRDRRAALMSEYNTTTEGLNKAAQEQANAAKKTGGGGGNSQQDKAMEGSIQWLNEQISLVKKLKDQQVVGTDEWIKWAGVLEGLNKQLDEAIGKEKQLSRPKLEPITLPVNLELPNKVDYKPIDISIKRDNLVKEFEKVRDEVSRIQGWLDIGVISKEDAEKELAKLQAQLKDKGINVDLKLNYDEQQLQTLSDQVGEVTDKFKNFGSVANNIVSPMNDIYESFKGFGDKMAEASNIWEEFFVVFQTGMTVLNAFSQITEGIAGAMEIINGLKAVFIALTKADTKATKENTKAKAEEAGITAAGAIASSVDSASKTPVVGWILAIAAAASVLAALMGAMSKAKGFAYGGIVPGNSFSGDKSLIRANSGEMVLTTEQQKELWKFIKNGSQGNESSGGSQVEFVLRGDQLIGLMNNTNKKNSKL